ncbi:MAG TPA: methyltransferase domain-containing protein [Pirellulales bacterium]|nr:methyltransferase domain-containing protein [Pirellulales bacterium]
MYQFGSRQSGEGDDGLTHLFPGREVIGIDQRRGPGVDRVEDYNWLSLGDDSAGTVVALGQVESTFDVPRFIDELLRVLRPGGTLMLAAVFNAEGSCSPSDYWRTTPGGLARLTAPLEARVLGWLGPERRPDLGYCVGTKRPTPARFADEADELMRAMTEWTATEEAMLPWGHRIAQKLLGRVARRLWRSDRTERYKLRFAVDLPDTNQWSRLMLPAKPERPGSRSKAG